MYQDIILFYLLCFVLIYYGGWNTRDQMKQNEITKLNNYEKRK